MRSYRLKNSFNGISLILAIEDFIYTEISSKIFADVIFIGEIDADELFAVCHLLVSLLHLLKRSAQQLQSLAERGNAKLHKFAEVCGARAVPRTVPRRDADSCPRTAALHHRGRGDGRA